MFKQPGKFYLPLSCIVKVCNVNMGEVQRNYEYASETHRGRYFVRCVTRQAIVADQVGSEGVEYVFPGDDVNGCLLPGYV